MQIISNPSRETWASLLERPHINSQNLTAIVDEVLCRIRQEGDNAVRAYELQFDKANLTDLQVSEAEIKEAEALVSDELKKALQIAKENIATFHAAQKHTLPKVETTQGVTCWQKAVPIEKVGLYVPGGTAPLFSTVLMLAIPAQIAGCQEIVLCTPPNAEGKINPIILYAAQLSGVSKVFKIGGIQAIGAMAYGTESVPKVYKIFGPGNQYVMAAKQQVSLHDVAIDMPAGPSEVAIIADETAKVGSVVADMLSQAEHGKDSQSIVFTTSPALAQALVAEIDAQVAVAPRKDFIKCSLEHSKIFILDNMDDVVAMSNEYAPEHLIIMCKDYASVAEQITNAGSVFMGYYTPESAGDYASGTNHTLPTSGYAKAYSGVNLDSYLKKITFQEITQQGIQKLADTIEIMAENEQLMAHKFAVSIRKQ
ncbi:MAG: histidinol dehydrogenase [Paludibacteraceae bacterium]|jgi:histidinol dehydrogenase|nr:histidinol dehydrogenase [Paludibacteraceae bacterium]